MPSAVSSDPVALSPLATEAPSHSAHACPLCECPHPIVRDSIKPGQIVKAWQALGVELSPAALGDFGSLAQVYLWECSSCGFQFSHLDHAGSALFYEELQCQLPNYYPPVSAEYPRAIAFAREHALTEVLDVGCGAGAFLNLAKKSGLDTHGIELNPKAAAVAREAGHTIYNELLETIIARGNYRRFSLVTTWQVLEHVPDPVTFLGECAELLKPGGFLAVAVPAEDGINSLAPYNPHVWPPHHVTRWRLKHLRQLGDKLQLKFIDGGNDPFDAYNARGMWELHNKLAPVFGYNPYPGGWFLPKLMAAGAARVHLHRLLPEWGHSTYAFYQKR